MQTIKENFPINPDLGLWKDNITRDISWLTLPIDECQGLLSKIIEFSNKYKGQYKHIIIVGMGGSSRPADVVRGVLGAKDGYAQIHVMENLDDDSIAEIKDNIKLKESLFISISKSGNTAETMALTKIAYSWIKEAELDPKEHFIAITTTSKESSLTKFLKDNNVSEESIFEHPRNVGGRFTFFSVIGMLPAALSGHDVEKILESTKKVLESDEKYNLGLFLVKMEEEGRPYMRVVLPEELKTIGAWIEQLIAESLGKIDRNGKNRGIIPILERDYDSSIYTDNVFCFRIKLGSSDSDDIFIQQLEGKNIPIWSIEVDSLYDALGVLYLLEFATGVSGILMGLDPFNQPGVEAKKQAARDMKTKIKDKISKGTRLEEAFKDEVKDNASSYRIEIADGIILDFGAIMEVSGSDLTSFALEKDIDIKTSKDAASIYSIIMQFANFKGKSYAGFFPYAHETKEREIAWALVRAIARKNNLQDVYGIGPVYEHSTAQFLQEGPDLGISIFVVINSKGNTIIPEDEVEGFSCGMQNVLQALGTQKALTKAGRFTLRIEVEGSLTEEKVKSLAKFFSSIE